MTKEEWEEYNELYDSDWRVRVEAGIDVGIWRDKLPRLKEVLHIDPEYKVVGIIVQNTDEGDVCVFDLEGKFQEVRTFYSHSQPTFIKEDKH
jgi:hypothetical protein